MTMPSRRIGTTCPLCGKHEPLWMAAPPAGCFDGGNSFCQRVLRNARTAALWRKLCPDAFDENGNMLPGQIVRVIEAATTAEVQSGGVG